MNRKRIDELRVLLVDAFMAEDTTTYSNAVLEMENLLGLEHGTRNHKGAMTPAKLEHNRTIGTRARQFRWGKRLLDAEIDVDGSFVYSIKY